MGTIRPGDPSAFKNKTIAQQQQLAFGRQQAADSLRAKLGQLSASGQAPDFIDQLMKNAQQDTAPVTFQGKHAAYLKPEQSHLDAVYLKPEQSHLDAVYLKPEQSHLDA